MYDDSDYYAQAAGDPALLARIAANYVGRYDVLDALWWRYHSSDPGPSGAESPYAEVVGLQRDLFSAAGSNVDSKARDRLDWLQDRLWEERKEIDRAIAAALLSPVRYGGSEAYAGAAVAHQDPEADSLPASLPPRRTRVPLRVLISATAGVVVGIVLGLLLAPSGNGGVELPAGTESVVAFDAFRRAQTADDIPKSGSGEELSIDPKIDRTSLRALTGTGRETNTTPYGALDSAGRVCLIVVASTSGESTAACETMAEFMTDGIQVEWITDEFMARGSSDDPTRVDQIVKWNVSGSISGSNRVVE